MYTMMPSKKKDSSVSSFPKVHLFWLSFCPRCAGLTLQCPVKRGWACPFLPGPGLRATVFSLWPWSVMWAVSGMCEDALYQSSVHAIKENQNPCLQYPDVFIMKIKCSSGEIESMICRSSLHFWKYPCACWVPFVSPLLLCVAFGDIFIELSPLRMAQKIMVPNHILFQIIHVHNII